MEDNIIPILEMVLRNTKMEKVDFSCSRNWPDEGLLPYPTSEEEVTAWICRRTKIYRETWLTQPIEMVLRMLRGEKRETND